MPIDSRATLPIFDGHNDTLLSLAVDARGRGRSFFDRNDEGHLDLPRAREGGFAGGMFAVFVPSERKLADKPEDDPDFTAFEGGYSMKLAKPVELSYAQRTANRMIAILCKIDRQSAGEVAIVRGADQLERCLQAGTLAAVLHFEGAEPIDPDLDALHVYHAAGLRSLGIVWSRPNVFGHGVPFAFPHSPDTGPGLTDAGRALVRECNQLGIVVDLSHLNERGFWDVAELSDAPLVATHSSVHALCPVSRNLTDKQLDAIKASRGMVGVNFEVSMLRADGGRDTDVPWEVLLAHVDYLVQRLGIDGVGFGSDFDGATMPNVLNDASRLQDLAAALRTRGYDDASLRKLTHENWLRVLRQTWK